MRAVASSASISPTSSRPYTFGRRLKTLKGLTPWFGSFAHEPAGLAGGFARRATARRRAVSLVMPVAIVTALAFTTFRTGHRVPSCRDTSSANPETDNALKIEIAVANSGNLTDVKSTVSERAAKQIEISGFGLKS